MARGAGNLIVPVLCPTLHRSGDIYRFADASDADAQQAHFLNKPVWQFLRIHDPAPTRRTRAYSSVFVPRANHSRSIETRNARNKNNVPLEPLSGVNSHHRDIRIKEIGETPQGTLGKDAHDIIEALRRIQRETVIFKVFPQRSKKYGIGPLVIESPGATQQFISDGVDYFVRSRPADALFSSRRLGILDKANAFNSMNSSSVSEKSPLKYEVPSLVSSSVMRLARAPRLRTRIAILPQPPGANNRSAQGNNKSGTASVWHHLCCNN